MEINLNNRSAVITGGSKGLGLATATLFAASEARVAILARDEGQLKDAREQIRNATGREVLVASCDVTQVSDVDRVFARLDDELGGIDILLNGAGRSDHGMFEEISDERWNDDLEIKLFGNIRCIRKVWGGMKERRWGRVLNIVNTGAKAPKPGCAPSHVSRAAQIAMTKILAHEGAPYNVLVNGLCVGRIMSDQFVRKFRDEVEGMSFDEFVALEGSVVPMGRLGTPEEFANLACFLASDAASYVTGAAINIDGGFSAVV